MHRNGSHAVIAVWLLQVGVAFTDAGDLSDDPKEARGTPLVNEIIHIYALPTYIAFDNVDRVRPSRALLRRLLRKMWQYVRLQKSKGLDTLNENRRNVNLYLQCRI